MALLELSEAADSVKALIVDDAPDILDVVSLCLDLRWTPSFRQLLSQNKRDSRHLLGSAHLGQ